jgi:predicted RNA methylase
MSGQKRFAKAIRNNRVVAIPSRKKEVVKTDENGQVLKDKNGEVVVENTQLYNIHKMR